MGGQRMMFTKELHRLPCRQVGVSVVLTLTSRGNFGIEIEDRQRQHCYGVESWAYLSNAWPHLHAVREVINREPSWELRGDDIYYRSEYVVRPSLDLVDWKSEKDRTGFDELWECAKLQELGISGHRHTRVNF